MALINGGNRTVGSADTLTVDASPSYDPDGVVTSLSYNWTCIKGGFHYGDDCGFTFDSTASKPSVEPTIGTGIYIFDVVVYDSYERSAAISATITVSTRHHAAIRDEVYYIHVDEW